VNVTPYPGTKGELFIGYVASKQGIKGGGQTSRLLVPDGKGGYRLATIREANKIFKKYGLPNIEEANEG
jgi:hypothetical protein